jgi:hypothetical protein
MSDSSGRCYSSWRELLADGEMSTYGPPARQLSKEPCSDLSERTMISVMYEWLMQGSNEQRFFEPLIKPARGICYLYRVRVYARRGQIPNTPYHTHYYVHAHACTLCMRRRRILLAHPKRKKIVILRTHLYLSRFCSHEDEGQHGRREKNQGNLQRFLRYYEV